MYSEGSNISSSRTRFSHVQFNSSTISTFTYVKIVSRVLILIEASNINKTRMSLSDCYNSQGKLDIIKLFLLLWNECAQTIIDEDQLPATTEVKKFQKRLESYIHIFIIISTCVGMMIQYWCLKSFKRWRGSDACENKIANWGLALLGILEGDGPFWRKYFYFWRST